jgi:carbon starvation protein
MGILLLAVAIFLFLTAYKSYGNFLSKRLEVNNNNSTPSHQLEDGVDYVPAKKPVLFGHHFASIAGVGPIVGPVLAVAFGWIPVYVWILFGAVFFGGVHDYSSIILSIRHKGKTLGAIIETYIGSSGKKLYLLFTWATLILVIAVFGIIIAKTFVSIPSAGSSSIFFIIAAVIFGILLNKYNLSLLVSTVIGIILLILSVILGQIYPIVLSREIWIILLFIYVFIASVIPVWMLLQPRDYLNSFFLYAILIGGIFGVFFSNPSVSLPVFTSFYNEKLGLLFPILFITVACGAISGFHSIVSSGTTSKQLDKENDAKFIGYGGMLLEGILAVIAMLSVSALPMDKYLSLLEKEGPVSAFSTGVAHFMQNIPLINFDFVTAKSFIALGIAAFALTTLDTSTRLARYTFQEFFEQSGKKEQTLLAKNRFVGTTITILLSAALTFSGKTMTLWPIFGSANQLLAALALLGITVWLFATGKKHSFAFIPTVFMFLVTITALVMITYNNIIVHQNYTLAIVSLMLTILAVLLWIEAYKVMFSKEKENHQK